MKLTFWGTRGSISKAGPSTLKYGGSTSCIEIRSSRGTLIILDCGTGALALGDSLLKGGGPINGYIFISHTHWDHIQGLPFFTPLFVPGNTFHIYGPKGLDTSLQQTLAGQMQYNYFPITVDAFAADVKYHGIVEESFMVGGDVQVTTRYLNHPALTLGYRIECDGTSVVYCTDHEMYDRGLAAGGYPAVGSADDQHCSFIKGCSLLVHDAQYTSEEYKQKAGWGHSTWEYAVHMAAWAQVETVALFHHDPRRSDDALDVVLAAASEKMRELTEGTTGCCTKVIGAQEQWSIEVPCRPVRLVRTRLAGDPVLTDPSRGVAVGDTVRVVVGEPSSGAVSGSSNTSFDGTSSRPCSPRDDVVYSRVSSGSAPRGGPIPHAPSPDNGGDNGACCGNRAPSGAGADGIDARKATFGSVSGPGPLPGEGGGAASNHDGIVMGEAQPMGRISEDFLYGKGNRVGGKGNDVERESGHPAGSAPVNAANGAGGEGAAGTGASRNPEGATGTYDSCCLAAIAPPEPKFVATFIADDGVRRQLQQALAEESCVVFCHADSEDELMELLASRQPSLVLLGKTLPGVDGGGLGLHLRVMNRNGAAHPYLVPMLVCEDGQRPPHQPHIQEFLDLPFSPAYARARVLSNLLRRPCRWVAAPFPPHEEERLRAVHALSLLDTEREMKYDLMTKLAAGIFQTELSVVTIMDLGRAWIKSCSVEGMDVRETPRDTTICAYTVLQDGVLEVEDTLQDDRFADTPFVTSGLVRFYAGVPLKATGGYNVGTLCLLHSRPRKLSLKQRDELWNMGELLSQLIQSGHAPLSPRHKRRG